MFIGHFGLAFAAKRAASRTSLGTTFVAAQLADLFWPILLLVDAEQLLVAGHEAAQKLPCPTLNHSFGFDGYRVCMLGP